MRGDFILDLSFVDNWMDDLKKMNEGKRGSPFLFPDSFMRWLIIWHQMVDFRSLEGISLVLSEEGIIPYSIDYSTICYRIHNMKPEVSMPKFKGLELATDGTGLKTSNGGGYRIFRYGDPDAKMKKHVVVVITADVKKKLIRTEAHIERPDKSEADVAEEHLKSAKSKGYSVTKFYGDVAFDTNRLFETLHVMGVDPVIKIRKNVAPENIGGSKWRRKEAREYKNKGYKDWAKEKGYGMRWPGTEGIFSAVKHKFGENTLSRSEEGLLAEGYQRFWTYDELMQYGEKRLGST